MFGDGREFAGFAVDASEGETLQGTVFDRVERFALLLLELKDVLFVLLDDALEETLPRVFFEVVGRRAVHLIHTPSRHRHQTRIPGAMLTTQVVLLLSAYHANDDLQSGLADRTHVTPHTAVAEGHGFSRRHVFETGTTVVGLDFLGCAETTADCMALEAQVQLFNGTFLPAATEVVDPGWLSTLKAKHGDYEDVTSWKDGGYR